MSRRRGRHFRQGDVRRVASLVTSHSGSARPYLLALVALSFEAVTAVFQPYPLAFLIDFLQGERAALGIDVPLLSTARSETVALLIAALLAITVVNSLCDSVAEIYLARAGRTLGFNVRAALHTHLQKLSLAFHDQRRTGDMLTRVTSDVTAVEDFVVKSTSDLAGSFLVLGGTLAFLFYRSWLVAVIAALIVPILAVISTHYSRRIKSAAKRQRAQEGDLASVAQEMLTSIRVIQTYSRADYETERFSTHSRGAMRAALETAVLQARFSWVVAVFQAVAIGAVVWTGLWLIDRDVITVGTLVLFTILIQNMFKPTRKIISEWGTIGRIVASVERIADVLDRRPTVTDAPDAVTAPTLRGRVSFEHVDFEYPLEHHSGFGTTAGLRNFALRDINLTIDSGEVVALVGPSGAGKSTIAQLIPRLYDPDAGTIRVDGLDTRRLTLHSLRSQISVVLQDTVLFNGTVAENIAYGLADATRAQVVQAAARANADGFITDLPDGYDTRLGERAVNLSGGQRQRIAIARAFVRGSPILILDEPTTGLDSESKEQVLLGLRSLIEGKTTLIITHDPSLSRFADRTVMVDEGRIVAPGAARAAESGDDLDALCSQALHTALPGLADALDVSIVAPQLQATLLGDGVALEECRPGKYLYRGDDGCSLRYDLCVRSASGKRRRVIALGRVLGDDAAAASYARTLAPLADSVADRIGAAGLAAPTASLRGGLVVHLFPVDPDLPTLVGATDGERVAEILRGFGVPATRCAFELAHYGRRDRCVLRYDVAGVAPQHRTIYGKVVAESDPGLVGAAVAAVRGRLGAVAVPAHYGTADELRLCLLGALPGEPALARELASKRRPDGLVDDAARAAAALHTGDVALGPLRSVECELDEMRALISGVDRISPRLATTLTGLLEVITTAAAATAAMPIGFVHGDFTPSQLLASDLGCGLVDFDTVARGEPALDLGQYLAYLRLAVAKAGSDGADELADARGDRFVAVYADAAGVAPAAGLRARADVYECISLLRTTIHAWAKLKPARARTLWPILTRQTACLASNFA